MKEFTDLQRFYSLGFRVWRVWEKWIKYEFKLPQGWGSLITSDHLSTTELHAVEMAFTWKQKSASKAIFIMVLLSFLIDHILTGGTERQGCTNMPWAARQDKWSNRSEKWKMNFRTTKTAAILWDNGNRDGKTDWMAEEQSLYVRSLTKILLITTTIGSQVIGLQKEWFEALQINSQQVIFSDGKGGMILPISSESKVY